MRRIWQLVQRFWTAEEIPRWFGLSLVLIYLGGVFVAAIFGISQVKNECAVRTQQASHAAIRLLASQMHAHSVSETDLEDPRKAGVIQRMLLDFAAHMPVRSLRLVNREGRVMSSIARQETGTTIERWEIETPSDRHQGAASRREEFASQLIRIPLYDVRSSLLSTPSSETTPPTPDLRPDSFLFLEAAFEEQPATLEMMTGQAGLYTVLSLGLAVLFVVHRRLRVQLRPVSRIADRLRYRGEQIEESLGALHISDAFDRTTQAWNDLIDLTRQLADDVRRNQANDELSRVLKRSSGGAVQNALNALSDGLVFVSEENRIEYANSAARGYFGWEAAGGSLLEPTEPAGSGLGRRLLQFVNEAVLADGSFESRNGLVEANAAGDDALNSYRVWIIPLQSDQQGKCLIVVRDVSQQVRADRSREEFVTQVTHELRTPLTNIRAYAETLASGMFDDPKVITECYNVITKETRRLSRLIDDVLNVSQFEAGSIQLHMDQVDLKALLSDAVKDVRGLADEKQIDIQIGLPAKMDPVRVDKDKIAVVINNLLGNAIKYTKSGGQIVVGCQFATDQAVITVKDNGIGIDPADHRRIFEKFQRGSDPDALQETGSGIGLYTARELARSHGGDIEVISRKGQGSTFLVRIPHQRSRAAAMSTTEER